MRPDRSSEAVAQGDTPATGRAAEAEAMMRQEVAIYSADMSAELAKMARSANLHLLSYFLDMAAAEARSAADRLSRGEAIEGDRIAPDQARL